MNFLFFIQVIKILGASLGLGQQDKNVWLLESRKEMGVGEGRNSRLGKVNRGNGLHRKFLQVCKMFVECPWRACDSQQKSWLLFLPDVAADNPPRETAYEIFNRFLLPQRIGIHNFQVGLTEKLIHLIKQSLLDIRWAGIKKKILFFFFNLFYTPYFSLHYLLAVLFTPSGWIPWRCNV